MTPTTDAVPTKTIGEWLVDLTYFSPQDFDEDILAMEVDSGCGEDCVKVLAKADELCEICGDTRDAIRVGVISQINVFYFG